jgi:chemotaxis protein CheY-P-specific phosphatase CheC
MPLTEQTLAGISREIISDLTFLTPLSMENEPATAPGPFMIGTVAFEGAFTGLVRIALPTGVVQELTCNMLGMEEGEPCDELQLSDALGELANVLCGHLVVAIAGPELVITLRPPEVHVVQAGEAEVVSLTPDTEGSLTQVRIPLQHGYADVAVSMNA